jgi:DNA (cytosine-5)-methyltransferase 1
VFGRYKKHTGIDGKIEMTFYNEFDRNAAAWLRELAENNLIAKGIIDERSIIDVQPDDVAGFRGVHWFAGIGGWDYALQLAGFPDDFPVWTASLPCQPFSKAGKGLGKADERHLLPHFLDLVDACRPPLIFGEQVESAVGHGWLDDLCAAMEAKNYTVWAAVFGAHSVGSPHQRQRVYWVAYRSGERYKKKSSIGSISSAENESDAWKNFAGSSSMGNSENYRLQWRDEESERERAERELERKDLWGKPKRSNHVGIMGDSESERCRKKGCEYIGESTQRTTWTGCEWISCRDEKSRPVKPGIQPLAYGISKGVVYSGDSGVEEDANATLEAKNMRIKGYGNAIVPQVAAVFIAAVMDCLRSI